MQEFRRKNAPFQQTVAPVAKVRFLRYDSATARSVMRTAIHNICYTVANSNAMQGFVPGAVQKTAMSPWMKLLIGADVVVLLLTAGSIYWMIRRTKQEKANPELFKRKAPKKAKNA